MIDDVKIIIIPFHLIKDTIPMQFIIIIVSLRYKNSNKNNTNKKIRRDYIVQLYRMDRTINSLAQL